MEEKLTNVITILPKKRFVGNYIYRHIATLNAEHYFRWCEVHELDDDLMSTVVEYVNTCHYDALNDYSVVRQKYNTEEIARAFRLFSHSLPVSGEWEDEVETTAFLQYAKACEESTPSTEPKMG